MPKTSREASQAVRLTAASAAAVAAVAAAARRCGQATGYALIPGVLSTTLLQGTCADGAQNVSQPTAVECQNNPEAATAATVAAATTTGVAVVVTDTTTGVAVVATMTGKYIHRSDRSANLT